MLVYSNVYVRELRHRVDSPLPPSRRYRAAAVEPSAALKHVAAYGISSRRQGMPRQRGRSAGQNSWQHFQVPREVRGRGGSFCGRTSARHEEDHHPIDPPGARLNQCLRCAPLPPGQKVPHSVLMVHEPSRSQNTNGMGEARHQNAGKHTLLDNELRSYHICIHVGVYYNSVTIVSS